VNAYVRAYYSTIPSFYGLLTRLGSLGAFPRLHRRAVETLEPRPGDTVLDMGCGTGMLLPFLMARVGPQGRVIGVDASPNMLIQARRRVQGQRWSNVDLRLADALAFEPPARLDGVIFSISLSAMPRCEQILERAIGFLKPGGRLVVLDALEAHGHPLYVLSNLYTRLKAPVVGSRFGNRICEVAQTSLDQVRIEVVHGGLYTIVSGMARR
jgi:ubiquinone/menaquinone biosynthesis C-methylase UbiE